jgi:hypothetical protein
LRILLLLHNTSDDKHGFPASWFVLLSLVARVDRYWHTQHPREHHNLGAGSVVKAFWDLAFGVLTFRQDTLGTEGNDLLGAHMIKVLKDIAVASGNAPVGTVALGITKGHPLILLVGTKFLPIIHLHYVAKVRFHPRQDGPPILFHPFLFIILLVALSVEFAVDHIRNPICGSTTMREQIKNVFHSFNTIPTRQMISKQRAKLVRLGVRMADVPCMGAMGNMPCPDTINL